MIKFSLLLVAELLSSAAQRFILMYFSHYFLSFKLNHMEAYLVHLPSVYSLTYSSVRIVLLHPI